MIIDRGCCCGYVGAMSICSDSRRLDEYVFLLQSTLSGEFRSLVCLFFSLCGLVVFGVPGLIA